MNLRSLVFIFCIFFCSNVLAADKIIAIDGVNGFVGSSLISNLREQNIRIGCYHCTGELFEGKKYFKGNIYDPKHLNKFLENVTIYYQMAALASVEPKNSLEEYILTNSIGPYIASRLNKSMTLVSMSTILVNDVEENEAVNIWLEKLMLHFSYLENDFYNITSSSLSKDLSSFINSNPVPKIKSYQYYGLSKLLLEKLLQKSSLTRSGIIVVIRPALVIGDNIHKRQGSSVVKSIMDSIFIGKDKYEVWNRTNYFTPIHKLKEMILYISNHKQLFEKFEIFDAGWVAMNQHDFARLILQSIPNKGDMLELVANTGFERKISMRTDIRLQKYYPDMSDVDQSIMEMTKTYRDSYIAGTG